MPPVPIVDTHVHLWDPHELSYAWLQDVPELNRPFSLEDFRGHSGGIDIEAMVFMECDVDHGRHREEASFAAAQAAREPRLRAMVAHAPLEKGAPVQTELEWLRQLKLLRGVRRLIQSEPRGFCLRPDFVAGVQLLSRFSLSFDICVYHHQLEDAIRLVRRSPEVHFVLDHLGKPAIREKLLEPWRAHLKELSELPNVHCKISGLTTEADHDKWAKEDIEPYIAHAVECFGFERLMYGGDWPVCTVATTYPRWVETVEWALRGSSEDELKKFWRDNAVRFYRLG